MEAEVMEEVCLELHQRGIDVLTVFDSIIVKEQDAEEAQEVFGNAFGELEPEIEVEKRSSKKRAEMGTNLAPDRPASAQSGADRKRRASQRLAKARPELFRTPQNGSKDAL
jgi:hypothetical protein